MTAVLIRYDIRCPYCGKSGPQISGMELTEISVSCWNRRCPVGGYTLKEKDLQRYAFPM